LKHPMTILHRSPNVFSFKEPLPYTYPPRQDMEYWSAGASAAINPRAQLRVIGKNLRLLFADPHNVPLWILIGGGLVILAVSPNPNRHFRQALRGWPLIVPGLLAPALYLLIFVEPRYVAPFLLLVLLGLLPAISIQNEKAHERRAAASTVCIAMSLTVFTALLVLYHLAGFPRTAPPGRLWIEVGESLNAVGVRSGEEVAIIGDSSDGCRWARMARVRIVSQVLREEVAAFWAASSIVKQDVYSAFARSGAKAVVAEEPPPAGELANWERVGETNYYVHFLSQSKAN
jgi:hypothetical protein